MPTFEIISTEDLLVNLENPDFKIFDVSTSLIPSASGVGYDARELKHTWIASRIPNSVYLDVNRYFSEPTNSVRYGVPGEKKIIDFMFEHDLGYEDHIVLYERSPSIWAPRVWWILTYYGFNNVKLLDCYVDHWESIGLPVQEGLFKKEAKRQQKKIFDKFNINPTMWISKREVQDGLIEENLILVNTLSPAVFRGSEVKYGRAGHIPGSINIYYKLFTTRVAERFLPESVCRDILNQFINLKEDKPIALYCGGGVSACLVAFVIRSLFIERQVLVYDGSLIEWMMSKINPVSTLPPV